MNMGDGAPAGTLPARSLTTDAGNPRGPISAIRRTNLPGRILVVVALAAGILASCTPGQPPKLKRIGYLHEASAADPVGGAEKAFFDALAELRWVDGQNAIIEKRFTEGKRDLAQQYAAELVRLPVDVIVANGNIRIQAAKDATSQIPIVMTNAGDPIGTGFVRSLAEPGGNITGMTTLSPGLADKRVELMKAMKPTMMRLAVLLNPDNDASPLNLRETEEAAAALGGIAVQPLEVRDEESLHRALDAAEAAGAEGLIALGDAIFFNYRAEIAAFGLRNRIPTHYNLRGFVLAEGLMAYGPNFPAVYARAATYVDRILKGANPAKLPVEQPTVFDLSINMCTADAIGLTPLPQSVLVQATELIPCPPG